jgi:hypothetical protein
LALSLAISKLCLIYEADSRPVPDLMISSNLGSCRLISPNLLVMKRRDRRNHLEPGSNLVVDSNVIALMKLDLVSPTMGANYRDL